MVTNLVEIPSTQQPTHRHDHGDEFAIQLNKIVKMSCKYSLKVPKVQCSTVKSEGEGLSLYGNKRELVPNKCCTDVSLPRTTHETVTL